MSRKVIATFSVSLALILGVGQRSNAQSEPPPAQIASASTTVQSASPQAVQQQNDGDGDDDSDELTYQWQNAKYTHDERRQIGFIVVVLSMVGLSSWARRLRPSAQGTNHRRPI